MPRIDDYKKAFELASKELEKLNPKRIADQAGARFLAGQNGQISLELEFLNRTIQIQWPNFEISVKDSDEQVPIQQQVLLLHYLLGAPGSKVENEWVAYQEIPDGRFYLDAFLRRAKQPMLKAFGSEPELLVKLASEAYGAREFDQGDCSVIVQAFPKVPVALILWKGDDEFPPDGNILFDRSVQEIFSAEDVAWLAGMIIYPLMAMAAKSKS